LAEFMFMILCISSATFSLFPGFCSLFAIYMYLEFSTYFESLGWCSIVFVWLHDMTKLVKMPLQIKHFHQPGQYWPQHQFWVVQIKNISEHHQLRENQWSKSFLIIGPIIIGLVLLHLSLFSWKTVVVAKQAPRMNVLSTPIIDDLYTQHDNSTGIKIKQCRSNSKTNTENTSLKIFIFIPVLLLCCVYISSLYCNIPSDLCPLFCLVIISTLFFNTCQDTQHSDRTSVKIKQCRSNNKKNSEYLCCVSWSSLYCNIPSNVCTLCLPCYYFYIVLSLHLSCRYVVYLDHHFAVLHLNGKFTMRKLKSSFLS
jgi:hypothetical protein